MVQDEFFMAFWDFPCAWAKI